MKTKNALRGLMSRLLPLRLLCLAGSAFAPAAFAQTPPPAAPIYEQLKSFGKPSPGSYPFGGLITGTDGALYGTAKGGTGSDYGMVFKLNPDGTSFTV